MLTQDSKWFKSNFLDGLYVGIVYFLRFLEIDLSKRTDFIWYGFYEIWDLKDKI